MKVQLIALIPCETTAQITITNTATAPIAGSAKGATRRPTVSRWNTVSPSIMSSWISVELWMSSTATAPGSAVAVGTSAASAPRKARVGRSALPSAASGQGSPRSPHQPMW